MSARQRRPDLAAAATASLSDAAMIAAARSAIVEETAARASAGLAASPVRALTRSAHALAQLASVASDGVLYNQAGSAVAACGMKAAVTPAGSMDDIASKLALLVSSMARAAPDALARPPLEYRLAVGLLVDVVMLRDGEATLPPGAADPVTDRIDAERWCRRRDILGA